MPQYQSSRRRALGNARTNRNAMIASLRRSEVRKKTSEVDKDGVETGVDQGTKFSWGFILEAGLPWRSTGHRGPMTEDRIGGRRPRTG